MRPVKALERRLLGADVVEFEHLRAQILWLAEDGLAWRSDPGDHFT